MVRTTSHRNVRILLIGDKGVGKTSIILSLVSEEFPEDVPSKAEEITIPADVTPELVPTHIVDFSESEQNDVESHLVGEIQKAHVICVVYSVDDEASLSHVGTHWLPLIRETVSEPYTCPVILVGNKVDLINDSTYEEASYIMDEYPEVESFVECSAKTLLNISEMFYYAQNAVLHPTAPLFDAEQQELTDSCKKALTRIFKICDTNNDGLLCDKELYLFQKKCFDTPLRKEAMHDIKTIISSNINEGIRDNKITVLGFVFLHSLFMQRGRSQTTWAVLRKFGYQEDLQMSKEYLYPKLNVPSGCTVELSHKGQAFFSSLFERYDKDGDGALSPTELESLFAVCPLPAFNSCIRHLVPTNHKGWITLDGWICFWVYTTYFDYLTTLEYLGYFGYPVLHTESQCTAVHVTREKKLDVMKKQSMRNVYLCHVIGEKGSGKSTICQAHIGARAEWNEVSEMLSSQSLDESPEEQAVAASPSRDRHHGSTITINNVHVYGQEKHLILKTVDLVNKTEPLMPTDIDCDIVCLVYDSSHSRSFQLIASIYLRYFNGSKIPVLIVASKCDLGNARQDYFAQPDAFCAQHNLPPPVRFSSIKLPVKKELFVKLATMAALPHVYNLGLIGTYEAMNLWKAAGLSATFILIAALALSKFIKTEKATSGSTTQ